VKENQKILSVRNNVLPGEEALFNIALIYAQYAYPKRDYQKSLEYFRRLIKVFPQSPLVGHSKIWIGNLQEEERLNIEIEELRKTIKKSKQVDIETDEKKKELSK
jgi:tetratricopeptide (TPR) repeat protein